MTNLQATLVLEPPYRSVRWLRDTAPALGGVLLIDGISGGATAQDAREAADLAPWCPVALLARRDHSRRAMRRSARVTVVYESEDAPGEVSARILDAVARRPRPSPSDMVEWVVRRTRLPLVARTLSELFHRAIRGQPSAVYLPPVHRAHVQQLGEWEWDDWAAAAQLAELAADRSRLGRLVSGPGRALDEAAGHAEALLGLTLDEVAARVGWEWVLELSLQRSGFFAARQQRDAAHADRPVVALRTWVDRREPVSVPSLQPTRLLGATLPGLRALERPA